MQPLLAELQIDVSQHQYQLLSQYCQLLRKWNRAFNMISRKDIQRLATRHILDSLTGATLLRGNHVLDVGSGAGLPGIPLACLHAQKEFVLVERMARRVRFLHHTVQALALQHVQIKQLDLLPGTQPAALGGKLFDTIVARAVEPALQLWQSVASLLAEQGQVLVYASTQTDQADPEQDQQIEENMLLKLAAEGVHVVSHKFPLDGRLHTILQMQHAG